MRAREGKTAQRSSDVATKEGNGEGNWWCGRVRARGQEMVTGKGMVREGDVKEQWSVGENASVIVERD